MTYEECLSRFEDRQRFSGTPGLARIARLLRQLGDPQRALRCVHIAGTNGKGSVSAMTASVLQKAGYRTGLFTSPHLVDFRERFRVDGALMEIDDFCRLSARVFAAQDALEREGFAPTNEFEMITALAFCYFAEQKCDYVLLEVGLGGRCDATNVIEQPAAVCITSISLDHTALLGDTVAQIAGEKAGIIKPGCAVVTPCTQAPDVLRVIGQTCEHRGAALRQTRLPEIISSDVTGSRIRYGGLEVTVPLSGLHQTENAACAIELCRLLGVQDACIQEGIALARWPGRMQLLQSDPPVLLDSGHNRGGIRALCAALDTFYAGRAITVIMGMMRDKDYADCIEQVARRARHFIGTQVAGTRALAASEAAGCAQRVCADAQSAPDLAAALSLAREKMEPDGLLVICGSVYLAGEALQLFAESGT